MMVSTLHLLLEVLFLHYCLDIKIDLTNKKIWQLTLPLIYFLVSLTIFEVRKSLVFKRCLVQHPKVVWCGFVDKLL